MEQVLEQKGICFVLLHFSSYQETYLLPALDLIRFLSSGYGEKVNAAWLYQRIGYVIEQSTFPQIPYLDTVKQHLLGGKTIWTNNLSGALLKYLGIGFLAAFIAAILIGGSVFFYYVSKAPELSESKLVATTSSKIYDSKNELIADLGAERRVNAQSNEIPIELVNAIVSIEDHRFFNHRGIDSIRIMGAFLRNLRSNGLQGGSTLTQQLIKLTYFSTSSSDQTISRKAQEAWLAIQLERTATKQEILTYYINKVYMSNGNYGMQTAAQNYYGKDLKDLSIPQLALLAGMPQAPKPIWSLFSSRRSNRTS